MAGPRPTRYGPRSSVGRKSSHDPSSSHSQNRSRDPAARGPLGRLRQDGPAGKARPAERRRPRYRPRRRPAPASGRRPAVAGGYGRSARPGHRVRAVAHPADRRLRPEPVRPAAARVVLQPLRQSAMILFELKGGELACEDVALSAIAHAVGTPVYVYSSAPLVRHFTVLRDALTGAGLKDPLSAFAVKANPNVAVIRTLAQAGAGADVVSEGEVRRALAAGVPPERIVFSGVGKSAGALEVAMQA